MTSSLSTLALRPATPDDHRALRRLAELDSQRLTAGPHLLAESDGRLVAAVDATTGRVVADPFVASADAVALLRGRLAQRTARLGGRAGILALRPRVRTT